MLMYVPIKKPDVLKVDELEKKYDYRTVSRTRCNAPHGLIRGRDAQRFRLHILSDVRHGSGSSIRSSILLHAHEDPPPEALLVGELDVYDPGAGDPPLFKILQDGFSLSH